MTERAPITLERRLTSRAGLLDELLDELLVKEFGSLEAALVDGPGTVRRLRLAVMEVGQLEWLLVQNTSERRIREGVAERALLRIGDYRRQARVPANGEPARLRQLEHEAVASTAQAVYLKLENAYIDKTINAKLNLKHSVDALQHSLNNLLRH